MEKIIITEEQAKVIENINSIHGGGMSDGYIVFRISQDINLPVTTIARIVEGEPYEVKREFKVGDIVWSSVTESVFEVTEKGNPKGLSIDALEINIKVGCWRYELVCKVENREYLQ